MISYDRVREQVLFPGFGSNMEAATTSPGTDLARGRTVTVGDVELYFQYAEKLYGEWPTPVCIVVDGPYGVGGFPGDPNSPRQLADWYRPHVKAWSRHATPQTTLWFWNTELGWANVHPVLDENGWEYRACHIWDKGKAHVAGNANSKTLRKLPVVTEVCVQYVKTPEFTIDGDDATMQDWLRYEWKRSGLPFYLSNEACGVKNAASRKYLASDHVWYYPPPEMFQKMVQYANENGDPEGRPYFSLDGERPISRDEWAKMRAKFDCPVGVNNVWEHPPVNGSERIKGHGRTKALHHNQKPLALVERTIELCTDPGDVVWEPFGGLCTAAVASQKLDRACSAAEIDPEYFLAAAERLASSARR